MSLSLPASVADVRPSYSMGFAPRNGPAANPNRRKGLLGAWHPYLGPTGLTVFDQSGRHSDGTLVNGPTWVIGPHGWVLQFAYSSSQYVVAPFRHITYPLTISVRAKLTSLSSDRALITVRNATNNDCFSLFMVSSNQVRFQVRSSGSYDNFDGVSNEVSVDEWHQIDMVCRSVSDIAWYCDLAEVASGATTYTPANLNAVEIGARTRSSVYLDGQILSVAIYECALSSAERAEQYADRYALSRLRQRVYPAAGAASGLSIPMAMHHYMQMMGAA